MDIISMDKEFNKVNLLTSDRYLRALDAVLRDSSEYAIFSREEWKTCLTCDNGKWKVAFVERGQDVCPKYFDDVIGACLYLIENVSPKKKTKKIKELYIDKVGTEPAVINSESKYIGALKRMAIF